MLENISTHTPGTIYDVLSKCFSDINGMKYKDKRSREIYEKLRHYKSDFDKLLEDLLKSNKDTELKDIVIENTQFNYLPLKDKLSEFMFFLLRVKNERGNLSETAETVAKYLNTSLFI